MNIDLCSMSKPFPATSFVKKARNILSAAIALCALTSPAAASSNPEFIDFIIKKAHERGLTSCDTAIQNAFTMVNGSDIRVTTTALPGIDPANSLKIHAVYGNPNDTIQQEAIFRNLGNSCSYSVTATFARNESCSAVLANSPAFKYSTEIHGVIYTKNAGDVDMLLTPIGTHACVQTIMLTQKY